MKIGAVRGVRLRMWWVISDSLEATVSDGRKHASSLGVCGA